MENATDIILTGCSGDFIIQKNLDLHGYCFYAAGGVSTFQHADLMSTLIPAGANYRAMADGG